MTEYKADTFMSYAVSYSQIGRLHMEKNMDNDDVIYIKEQKNFFFYGLADGQSGKKYCKEGAEDVLKAVADYMEEKSIHALSHYEHRDEIQYEIIRIVREKIEYLAQKSNTETIEFASTILAFGINPITGEYMVIHLGDGGVIGNCMDGCLNFISAPENGITSKYTWLTTSENALLHLRVSFGYINKYKQIIMYTDGAEAICRGTNITTKTRKILKNKESPEQIVGLIVASKPIDDASCIVISCNKMLGDFKEKDSDSDL